jgi:hypothetical protein
MSISNGFTCAFPEGTTKMRQLAIVVLALFAGFGTSTASTIVSTFSTTPPGYVSDSYELSLVSSPPFGIQNLQWAMGFTVPAGSDYLFTGFIVPMTFSGTTTTVDFTLASDAGGAPGSALETIDVTLSNGTAVYTGDSILDPTLIAGASYWLEAAISPSDLGTDASWNASAGIFSGLALGPTADRDPPFPTNWSVSTGTQAAFEIDGTAVPEPRYGWIVIFGCLLTGTKMFRLFRATSSREIQQ